MICSYARSITNSSRVSKLTSSSPSWPYCLHVTLRARLRPLAPGLTSRAVLDKLAAVQMLDVHFPTTDGRTLILSRYTELNADQKLLVKQLNLELPPQPPPRITAPARLARTLTRPMYRRPTRRTDSAHIFPAT